MLFAFAYRRVQDQQLAEDLVQECLLKGYSGLGQFQGQSQLSTWLTGILKNLIYDQYRKQHRSVEVDLDEGLDEYFIEDGHWRHDNLQEEILQRALQRNLDLCLECLDDKYRIPFLLKEQESLSGEDISEILGIKTNALWIILHRARLKLKTCIERGDQI